MKIGYISKYRTHIMGAAMIWVMFFHSAFHSKISMIQFIHNIGFYGVDMFLLVSGLGLYFSMKKSKNIGQFYLKRVIRILPAYLIISISWYLFYKTDVSAGDAILSVIGINYWRGSIYGRPPYFDWFIPTLLVLYILTPLYFKLFEKVKCKWQFTALVSLISPILCIVFYHQGKQPLYGSIVRIPVFLIGFYLGYFIYEKKEDNKQNWMALLSFMALGLIAGYYIQTYVSNPTIIWGINAYPATLVAPGLCSLIGLIGLKLEKNLKTVGTVLLFPLYVCGRYSLEIYLFHQRFLELFASPRFTCFYTFINANLGSKGYYWFCALASIAAAAALHELISFIIRLLTPKKGNKNSVKKSEKTPKKKKILSSNKTL